MRRKKFELRTADCVVRDRSWPSTQPQQVSSHLLSGLYPEPACSAGPEPCSSPETCSGPECTALARLVLAQCFPHARVDLHIHPASLHLILLRKGLLQPCSGFSGKGEGNCWKSLWFLEIENFAARAPKLADFSEINLKKCYIPPPCSLQVNLKLIVHMTVGVVWQGVQ